VGVRLAFAAGVLCLLVLPRLSAQPLSSPTAYLSHEQARPVFEALEERLPPAGEWRQWIAAADRATRARVGQGDEISIVNLLLFGTSFTRQPRITTPQLDAKQNDAAVAARLIDFERALAQPGTNERLLFARQTVGDMPQARIRLVSMLERAISESATYASLDAAAGALKDPSLEFAERSRLYRTRGLSSDTSIRTNMAVEEALKQIHTGARERRLVRRVAIIGPGLDFTDKQGGYDFYPQQTIQPFAIMDSLIRLGLARANMLTVTTFDLSGRVNEHIERARGRARQGVPYVIQLPLDTDVSWTPAMLRYWQQFGDTIAVEVPALPGPPAAGRLKMRSVGVRPSVVERITARDLNITAQHLPLADDERFDVIIATNVFVYYDRLQQALAMVNVANMLRPGGLLLSNNAVVELPTTGLNAIGYSRTQYSSREEDGDLVIWYEMRVTAPLPRERP